MGCTGNIGGLDLLGDFVVGLQNNENNGRAERKGSANYTKTKNDARFRRRRRKMYSPRKKYSFHFIAPSLPPTANPPTKVREFSHTLLGKPIRDFYIISLIHTLCHYILKMQYTSIQYMVLTNLKKLSLHVIIIMKKMTDEIRKSNEVQRKIRS